MTLKLNIRLRKDAYTVGALVDAGVPPATARKLLVADNAPACRPRVSIHGRKRDPETTTYVWGPDALTLLAEPAQLEVLSVTQ